MNASLEESAFEREFAVRYRFPRPVSRSYESVLYARYGAEIRNKSEWCARIAIRFLAVVQQALYLAANPDALAGPPSARDLKLESDFAPFTPLSPMPSPVTLLQHAGIYPGAVDRGDRRSLLASLELAGSLTRYRIACVESEGIRVLLGPRMEYFIWSDNLAGDFEIGTPLLVDIVTADYISLKPLMVWHRDPHWS